MTRRILALLVALAATVGSQEHLILVVRQDAAPRPTSTIPGETPPAAPASSDAAEAARFQRPPKTPEEVYELWRHHPLQFHIDSPSGPVEAMGMDTVPDGHGRVTVRVPDPYTYEIARDPMDPVKMQRYLDYRKANIRWARLTMEQIPEHAWRTGMIDEQTVAPGPSRSKEQFNVADLSIVDPAALTVPMVNATQARELGMDQVPLLPGDHEAPIEVLWFWHPRCPLCQQMARDWYRFQREISGSGYKAFGLSTSTDATDSASAVYLWTLLWGQDVEQSNNRQDNDDLTKAFSVKGTPSVVMIRRKPLKIVRLNGVHSLAELRGAFADLAGLHPGQWPPPAVKPAPNDVAPPAEDIIPLPEGDDDKPMTKIETLAP